MNKNSKLQQQQTLYLRPGCVIFVSGLVLFLTLTLEQITVGVGLSSKQEMTNKQTQILELLEEG
jgi:hypothetical protein